MQIREAIQIAAAKLSFVAEDRSISEARLLLAHVLSTSPTNLIVQDDLELSEKELAQFESYLDRRLRFEPIAYIREEKEFYGFVFKVNNSVLIPRPETEQLVDLILEHLKRTSVKQGLILDLGTGSGCIAISLAKHLQSQFQVIGVDISTAAVHLARQNARALKALNVEFVVNDFRTMSPQHFGVPLVVVSNPPYIPSAELHSLSRDIRNYEPHLALDGGPGGLDLIRCIVENYFVSLSRPGWLALETSGPEQIAEIQRDFEFSSYLINGPHLVIEKV